MVVLASLKKYWRWIVFGLVAIGLIVLWLLVSSNKSLRQKLEVMLLERFVKNKVDGLEDQASAAKALAESGASDAAAAEATARQLAVAVAQQKATLQQGLESRGLDADQIAERFRNINF